MPSESVQDTTFNLKVSKYVLNGRKKLNAGSQQEGIARTQSILRGEF